MEVCTSVVNDFSEVYGSIGLKSCPKKVKYIFDIQNGGLAAILFEICILYFFFTNFHQIFIEIATVPTISNGFL